MAFIGLSGCYYDHVLPAQVEGDISYAQEIQPIFNSKCTSCHGGTSPAIGLDLEAANSYNNLINGNFINVSDPVNSLLYVKINSGSMAIYASDLDRATILKWIEEGAKNN